MTLKNPKVNEPQTQYQILRERTEVAKEGLLDDIENWYMGLPDNIPINFHVGQFKTFCDRVFEQLKGTSKADVLFRSQVIGGLTSQWLILREVAALRVEGSPYRASLDELDRKAAQHYRAVWQALPEKARNFIPSSPPLISLGRSAEFFLFNSQDETPPAVINIPFGAAYDSAKAYSRLAISHEIGHAIFDRIEPCLPQLETAVKAVLDSDSNLTRLQQVTHRVIMPWLSEMVADLTGTALSGPDSGHTAIRIGAGPEAYMSLTDEVHPLPIIRPYIHLKFLEYLDQEATPEQADILQDYRAGQTNLRSSIEASIGAEDLSRRFEAVPALAQVTLADVREEMLTITELVLKSELSIFGGKSLGAILIDCAVNMKQSEEAVLATRMSLLEPWGQKIQIGPPFVLDFSHMAAPTYAVPVTKGLLCEYFDIAC